jgi:Protein of unknown function (DUF1553)/Protein of unknown function (DUF1549)
MKIFLLLVLGLFAAVDRMSAAGVDATVYEGSAAMVAECPIDRLVFPKLMRMGITPSVCSDAVFVRRAFLDMLGKLPTAKEAREFIQSTDSRNKRRLLIELLLQRPEYADYWSMKWGDLLRIKAEFPVNLWPNAAQAYYRWVWASLNENKPYDQFVREMLTSSGSNFRVGPVNFYRAVQAKNPEGIATTVALTFLGSRAEFWPKHYLPGMAGFFSQIGYKATREWKEEIVYWDPSKAAAWSTNGVARPAVFPDGTEIQLPPDKDPREVFADWLIQPKNPWFTLNIVNRMWSWMLGRGIIHEPDDIRSNNPPGNPELLAYLQQELVNGHYDMKHIFRLIMNSRTYQFSSMPKFNAAKAEANFGAYPLRRLDAEVLIDALNQITGSSDLYTSAIPEPFTYIPENKPAVALPDGSISSPFLELFGRPPRATGLENERINKPMPSQRLHMLNSSHIQRKLEDGPKLKPLIDDTKRKPRELIEELYLTILSRFPTPDELRNAEAYTHSSVVKGREGYVDVAWALVNSAEFMYRH